MRHAPMVLTMTRSRSTSPPTCVRGPPDALWMCQLISSPSSSSELLMLGLSWDEAGLVDADDGAWSLSFPNLSLENDFAVCKGRLVMGPRAALAELPNR